MDIVGAGIIVEDINEKILVIRRKQFVVPEGGKWGIPGGGVVEDVTPLETAKIKTKQEVGITTTEDKLTLLDKFSYQAEGNNVTFYVWIYKIGDSDPKVLLNLDAHDAYKWKEPTELYQQKDLMVGMYPILEKYLRLKGK